MRALAILCFVLTITVSGSALAAPNQLCVDAGISPGQPGYGLCNAFDVVGCHEDAGTKTCQKILKNFAKTTGGVTMPGCGEEVCDEVDNDCDGEIDEGDVCVICPCFDSSDLDAAWDAVGKPETPSHDAYLTCSERSIASDPNGFIGVSYSFFYSAAGLPSGGQGLFWLLPVNSKGHGQCRTERYTWNPHSSWYDFKIITAAEVDGCWQLIRDWTTDNGLSCLQY